MEQQQQSVTHIQKIKQNPDFVVVIDTMIAEKYGAYLWTVSTGAEMLSIAPGGKLSGEHALLLKGKHVLVVGGYFRVGDKLVPDEITNACASLTLVISSGDYDASSMKEEGDPSFILLDEISGFATWTCKQLRITDAAVTRMVAYLDEYIYGYPSESAICFQNGVYTLEANNDLDRLLTINTVEDVDLVIEKGRSKWIANGRTVGVRERTAKIFNVDTRLLGKPIAQVLVSIGDSPILESCLALAEKSPDGVGMLFRYDLLKSRTFITIRTARGSQFHAGKLAKLLVNGGGNAAMGGGSVPGLFFPSDLLKAFEETTL